MGCHRFVGYLEEQALITYSDILQKMDSGHLPMWSSLPAPEIAVTYWKLSDKAVMRDVILAIRADEAHHRVVSHTLLVLVNSLLLWIPATEMSIDHFSNAL